MLLQWEDTPTSDLIDLADIETLWNSDIRSDMVPSGSISSFFRITINTKISDDPEVFKFYVLGLFICFISMIDYATY